jgi:hypothetical protein
VISSPPSLNAVRLRLLPAVGLLVKFERPPQIWYRKSSDRMEFAPNQLSVLLRRMFANVQSVQSRLEPFHSFGDSLVCEFSIFNWARPRVNSLLEDGNSLRPWNVITQPGPCDLDCPRSFGEWSETRLVSERVMQHRSRVSHTFVNDWFAVWGEFRITRAVTEPVVLPLTILIGFSQPRPYGTPSGKEFFCGGLYITLYFTPHPTLPVFI